MFCNNFGVAVAGAANFCSRCGNRILPTSASVSAMEASPRNLMDLLPGRLDKLLSELLEPGEKVHIKLKDAFVEDLICTNKRVLILKAGSITGQTFGSNVFQVPYHNIM